MPKVEFQIPEMDYSSSESYKSLRTNLQFCGSDKKVIAVTSCTPNEGKSSVVLNLAVSLCEAGKKVVIVDADMRNSVMMGKVRVTESVKGLSHFLSRQVSLNDSICSTNVKNLHVIFAGPVPPNPTELLGGRLFGDMINALKDVCDYVLVDTPPLGSVIDSAIIAEQCDGCVVVIASGETSYRFAQNVKGQLEKTGCPILGVILNKVDAAAVGYYGKYGSYGKYGGYGEHKVAAASEGKMG